MWIGLEIQRLYLHFHVHINSGERLMSFDELFKNAHQNQVDKQAAEKTANQALADENIRNIRDAEELLRAVVDPIFAEAAKTAQDNAYIGMNRLIQSDTKFAHGGNVSAFTIAELSIAKKNQSGKPAVLTFTYQISSRSLKSASSVAMVTTGTSDFSLITPNVVRLLVQDFIEHALRS
jgi:hypothetical protein